MIIIFNLIFTTGLWLLRFKTIVEMAENKMITYYLEYTYYAWYIIIYKIIM